MIIRVYPYKMASSSSKLLSTELGCKRVHPDKAFKGGDRYTIINWGSTLRPNWYDRGERWLNTLGAVSTACDKLLSLMSFKENKVSYPEFTTDIKEAFVWLRKSDIICRAKLHGKGGEGITLVKQGKDELPEVPLYTKYIPKKEEHRVHVVDGKVIDHQIKRKRRGVANADVNYQIRVVDTGWVYCRNHLVERNGMFALAVSAVNALGLTFGAVDIIWNQKADTCYVLEVNTAPGLEGTTVDSYVKAFKEYR